MKRILILNLSASGHHPRYNRWVLECNACRNAEVVVAGRSELFEHTALKDISGNFQCHSVLLSKKQQKILSDTSSIAALIHRQFAFWEIWRNTYEDVSAKGRVDLVLMLCADDCLDAIAMKGSPFKTTPWAGIALKPRFHFGRMGVSAPIPRFSALREWLFRRAMRDRFLASLFTIDPTLYEYANLYLGKKERQNLEFLPDPAPDLDLQLSSNAREALGIPQDAKVVLAYGSLSERKGIRELIECAIDGGCPSNVFLLLAGEQAPEIRALLAGLASATLRKQERLKIIDGYVLDAEAAVLLAAADCMWVGYREFFMMSAVLVLAARHGIPCIGSDYGIVGYMMRKHQFGLTVDPDDKGSVLAALREVSSDAGQLASNGRRAMAAFSRHSVPEFQKMISTMIETWVPSSGRRQEANDQ